MKPLLSDKSRKRARINISETGEISKTESEIAETLNIFFSNIAKNLNISRYREFDPVKENIANPTLETPCLNTPAESILESSPVKMRPTKSVPGEKGLDFLHARCVLVI